VEEEEDGRAEGEAADVADAVAVASDRGPESEWWPRKAS
jgi:hypothetical protein